MQLHVSFLSFVPPRVALVYEREPPSDRVLDEKDLINVAEKLDLDPSLFQHHVEGQLGEGDEVTEKKNLSKYKQKINKFCDSPTIQLSFGEYFFSKFAENFSEQVHIQQTVV